MSNVIRVFLVFALAVPVMRAEKQRLGTREGDPTLEWTVGQRKVKVTFHLRLVRSTDAAFSVLFDVCEPEPLVSIVRGVDISIDGRVVQARISVGAGLVELHYADVQRLNNGTYLLSLTGADAGYSYDVRINFNAAHVTRKRVSGVPDWAKTTEDTFYYYYDWGKIFK